jgi:hypothetical protein
VIQQLGTMFPNMTLQVGGVSKIESVNYTQFKTTDPTSRQRKRPTPLNKKPSKIIQERKKICGGSEWGA